MSNWIVFRDNSDSVLKCLDLFGLIRIMKRRAWVYVKLMAEKCVEDVSEYI